MNRSIGYCLLLGGTALGGFVPVCAAQAQAQAQTQTQPSVEVPADVPDTSSLPDIIVTAQRTESSLQRTPIAVTAVSGVDLKARGATSLLDVQNFTPGLQVGSRSGVGAQQGSFSIRGIGVDATSSAPSVGIYIDDVYYPSGSGNLLGLFDVQRVEVLRGPQGTLFGRNTIAGAIQYITVQPGRDFTGFVDGTLGNFERRDISGAVTIPLGDTLSTRFAAQHTNRDGFVYDELNDINRGGDTVTQAAAKLRWTPMGSLTVDLKGDYLEQDLNGRPLAVLVILPNGQFPQVATNPMILGPFAYTGPFDDRFLSARDYRFAGFNGRDSFSYRYWSANGTIRYDISDAVTIKSISSYSRSELRSFTDFDATPAAIVQIVGGDPQILKVFTQEVQLSGISFSERLKWTADVYYYNSVDEDNNRSILLGNLPPAAAQLSNGNTILKTRAIAGYAQGTFNFTGQFSVVAGLRYSNERVNGTNLTFPRPALSTSFSNVAPLIGVNFQATPDMLFYVKASRGFRAGGFAISGSLAAGFIAYDPETAWTYEAGARLQLFDGRLRINPTIYYTDWKSIQFNFLVVGTTQGGLPTTAPATANAGDAQIHGAELEAQFAATDRLRFIASAATTNGSYSNIAPGIFLTRDSPLQRSPKFKYAVGARYTYPLANQSSLAANVDWSHTSSQSSATTDDTTIPLPAYGLLSARLQYTLPGGKLSIAAFGTNLTNSYYYVGGAGIGLAFVTGSSEADLARPREYGVNLRFAF